MVFNKNKLLFLIKITLYQNKKKEPNEKIHGIYDFTLHFIYRVRTLVVEH